MNQTVELRANEENRPRVLVVENDARTATMHKHNLERWGYQPILATGVGEALLSDAQAKANEYACHIALVDMHLLDDYDETDKSGLDLVHKLKPTLSIIVSGSGNNRQTVLEALHKEAVDFIGKEEPLIRLQGALAQAKRQSCFAEGDLSIDIAETLVTQMMSSLAPGKPDQVRDVLRALFPEAHTISVELLDGSTRTPSVNLRRESYVLKVRPDSLQPFAVKLANPERIQQEVRNYNDYIEHRLEHNCYAKIVGTVSRWHIGGISYEFFGSGIETFTLFSQYYAGNSTQALCKTISYLFEHVWSSHLSQQRETTVRSLFYQFSSRWNQKKWLERLDAYLDRLNAHTYDDALIGQFSDPVLWVKERTGKWGSAPNRGEDATTKFGRLMEAVGHGDLQGDNFFVNDHQQAWMIDYERTGYGPAVQDFVLLEFDIWARLADIPERTDFLRLLVGMTEQKLSTRLEIAEGSPNEAEIKKAYRVIFRIRGLASKVVKDPRIYLWGVLLNAVFRIVLLEEKLTLAQNSTAFKRLFQERERAMLVGAVLCRRLDDWEKNWPPPEWKLNKGSTGSANADTPLTEPSHPVKLLFLTASPVNWQALQVEEELRALMQILSSQESKNRLDLAYHGAVRLKELRVFLLKHNPCILHFAGHGNELGEILVKDEFGRSSPIPAEAFGEMLAILSTNLRCVILNACYTDKQANVIGNYVDAVIVMQAQIEDRSAIAFTKGFYEALIYNHTLQTCFESGLNEIKLQRLSGQETPRLICQRGDPSKVHLL